MGHSFHDCLEVRTLDEDEFGNSRNWIRLAHSVVAGEEPPTLRVAAVADMIMSSASRLGPG